MDKITTLASTCRIASSHDSVLNSECAFTFHSPYTTENGIVINLSSFIGSIDELSFGVEDDTPNGQNDVMEGLFVRIVKKRIVKEANENESKKDEEGEEEDSLTQKVTKLGVGVDGGFKSEDDHFTTITSHSIVVLSKGSDGKVRVVVELPYTAESKVTFPTNVSMSADSVIHHSGMAVQQDLKAWELDDEPKPVSKYASSIEFVNNDITVSPNPSDWKCEKSGDTENLWLNLSDGFIGGGRKNWDGSGGSNGALDHFKETGEKYPLVVKLGTITADLDTADCYSYAKDEDGPVTVPNLADLLAKRGIMVAGMQKIVKSTAELEVELNATYAFDAITEAGASLVPISGPCLQGLQNLGNSCYINSVVQMLFGGSIPEIVARYGVTPNGDITSHPLFDISPENAPSDLLCQTAKLSCALTSGSFARPLHNSAVLSDDKSTDTDPKYRLAPRMFKHVIGKDHVDFCTGQQQDAAQYLQYVFEKIDRAELGAKDRLKNKSDSSNSIPLTSNLFSFKTTSKISCNEDKTIKYKDNAPETILSLRIPMPEEVKSSINSEEPDEKRLKSENEIPTVTLQSCLSAWSAPHRIDGLRWSHLNNDISAAMEEVGFSNFPRYLIVQMQRYELGPDWTPKKIEVNIQMDLEIDLNQYKLEGSKDDKDLFPNNNDVKVSEMSTNTPAVSIKEESLAQLLDMGFSLNGCQRALMTVGGSDVQGAMNWIFEHNGDPDFNDPLPDSSNKNGNTNASLVDEDVVTRLVENLGCFTGDQVRTALQETGGAPDRAADWLFTHMDDLDASIAAIQSDNTSCKTKLSKTQVEDGNGKYELVGLISHIGKNTGSGHYVAHLKKNDNWVIFNDEKVAYSDSPPIPHAYLYLFQRLDSKSFKNKDY